MKSHPRNLFALKWPLRFSLSSTSFASLRQQRSEIAASPVPLGRFPGEGCSLTPAPHTGSHPRGWRGPGSRRPISPGGRTSFLGPTSGFANTLWSRAERLLWREQLPGDRASAACPEPARLLAIYSGREEPGPVAASAADPPGRQTGHSSGTGSWG